EWEDWTFEAHSGASIVPTALAAGELADASGKELVAAIVAGNEILARSGDVLTDVIHAGNALATHQIETPLVAGKLLGLGPTRLAQLVDGLGKTWRFDAKYDQLFTKRFPTDGFQLTSIQAILDIVNRQAKKVWDSTPRSRLPRIVKRVEVRIPWVMAASATMFSKGTKDIYARIRREPDWTYIALLFDGKYPVA